MISGGAARAGGYTFVTLDDPNATNGTFASGINDSGAVVGHFAVGFTNEGFLYKNGQYTTIQVNGLNATLTSINNAGTMAGFYSDAAGIHGFTMTAGGTVNTIDDPNAINGTEITGINNKGDVVGFYFDGSSTAHGFSLINGMFKTIDDPGAGMGLERGTFAQGINDADLITGGLIGGSAGQVGFTYDGTNFTHFTVPGATSTFGGGINDAAAIAGYFNDSSGQHGFVDMGGQFTALDAPGNPISTRAFGINASGTVAGYYLDANFHAHGFVATAASVPEPGALTLAAIGVASPLAVRLGRAARRRD
jgi:hypothetical protein